MVYFVNQFYFVFTETLQVFQSCNKYTTKTKNKKDSTYVIAESCEGKFISQLLQGFYSTPAVFTRMEKLGSPSSRKLVSCKIFH